MRKKNKIEKLLSVIIVAAGLVTLSHTVHLVITANPSIGTYLLDADYQDDPLISR